MALIDQRTGLIDRSWYMFFLSLFNAANVVVDGDVGPNAESLLASYDAALRALADEVAVRFAFARSLNAFAALGLVAAGDHLVRFGDLLVQLFELLVLSGELGERAAFLRQRRNRGMRDVVPVNLEEPALFNQMLSDFLMRVTVR